ncbi:MAG: methyltransferase domain-containing protein [Bdellovibrionales bacterium]|nr:methyltransferase domain-containing protein [Bdellovibrionales bacterium]
MFDPKDPFPLLNVGQLSYAQQKDHASAVDQWLGFKINEIELLLQEQRPKETWAENWIGLAPETLQTPYVEIRGLLERLEIQPGTTIADLGCAYGRMAHVIQTHFPQNNFVGVESVSLRIQEAERVAKQRGLNNCRWIHSDFAQPDSPLPAADILFIYDSSTTQALRTLLEKIRTTGKINRRIKVVGRGRRIRDLIEREEPWLSQVNRPQHFDNFSIYLS